MHHRVAVHLHHVEQALFLNRGKLAVLTEAGIVDQQIDLNSFFFGECKNPFRGEEQHLYFLVTAKRSTRRPPSCLIRSVRRRAQTNSAANNPSPRKIESIPGPGLTNITPPASSKVNPAMMRKTRRPAQPCAES